MTPLLTATELREYLNISRSTLARLVAAGLPHIGSGRLRRFDKETLLRWYSINT